jgi:cytochrome c-type biogenesis protein CcmH
MRAILLIGIAAISAAAYATAMTAASPSAVLDARLKKLETELRCLVCQNQTLADSNADLAGDLRREVRELALSGRNDVEIRDYLVARYGDFVLYDPPLKRTTWLLWFGPFVLLAGGGLLWWQVLSRRQRAPAAAPAPARCSTTSRPRSHELAGAGPVPQRRQATGWRRSASTTRSSPDFPRGTSGKIRCLPIARARGRSRRAPPPREAGRAR